MFLTAAPSSAAGAMLHRNLRTGGYDLPGVESGDIPLIGYRPLSPDRGAPIGQSGGRGEDVDPSQVGVFYFLGAEPLRVLTVLFEL